MKPNRRTFVKKLSLTTLGVVLPLNNIRSHVFDLEQKITKGINPWIEISKNAYLQNAREISKMGNGKPVLAVLKNNAYGIGDVEVAKILDKSPHIHGFALVKEARCLSLRKAGVKKPILLMGDFDTKLGPEMVTAGITFSVFSKESVQKILDLSSKSQSSIKVQLYFDTGLGRMGMPYDKALDWVLELVHKKNIEITGLFSTLTTPTDFALEQIQRFKSLKQKLKEMDVPVKNCHIAPSSSLLELEESHMDIVRPGILLHGSYPLLNMKHSNEHSLQPTFRLRAKVIRVERLKKGDTIGFSRFYEVSSDEWIATIPIGWAEGYAGAAENGAKVMINKKLYNVVNVNSSHCNILIGNTKDVSVGDVATMIGPDAPEITPKGFAHLIDGHTYLQINYKESIPKYVVDEFD